MFLRSWATINIQNIIENLKNLHTFTKKGIFSVVKADAYGHDARIVSRAIQELKFVKKLCVATPLEGKELREVGVEKDILVLGGILPGEESLFTDYRLTPVISTYESLYLARQNKIRKIHLKFDTGMSRLGFYGEDIKTLRKLLSDFDVEGIMSHLSSADTDPEFTNRQMENFQDIVNYLNIPVEHIHLQNSAGILFPCDFCTDVRVGLSMYGEKPTHNFPLQLKGVMSVYAKIISVKDVKKGSKISYCGTFQAKEDMKVGVVSFGYADGLPRLLSNKGHILVGGKRARIVGNITMDMTMVDISQFNVKVGEEVIVVGESDEERITFTEIANLAGTIPYEIMCGISKRVVRVIKGEVKDAEYTCSRR